MRRELFHAPCKSQCRYKRSPHQRVDLRGAEAEEQAEALREEMNKEIELSKDSRNWISKFRENQNITELDRSVIVTLIERVMIFRDKRVEIVFRWQNEYQRYVDLITLALSERRAV